ncbi:MAG: ATP-binding cassette domain-containing protein, partial [Egibacteraceae bacterium]
MDPVLDIRGLHKTFTLYAAGNRTVEAVRGVSLRVGAGEHVALAGPSGAGKSSILKCVYRTYLPSAGTIHFWPASAGAPVDLARLPDREVAGLRHTEIAYVSQFLRAEPRRSALTVVARAGMRGGMDARLAAHAAAETLGRLRL